MSFDLEKMTFPLKVVRKINETDDTVSFVFDVPATLKEKFSFQPGQFVTLFLDINGEAMARSYSIPSSPAVDRDLKITVKRVPGGKASNFLIDRVHEGDQLRLSPPAGNFYRPQSDGPHHYVLAAGGSGITPLFSILKTLLLTDPQSRVSLLYANRFEDSVIFDHELSSLAERFPDRLQVRTVISQPSQDWTGWRGRCEGPQLDQWLGRMLNFSRLPVVAYLCGPDGYMKNVRASLTRLRVEKVFEESFSAGQSSSPTQSHHQVEPIQIGDLRAQNMNEQAEVEVLLNGQKTQHLIRRDQTILQALIDAGANPPYSCLEGNCMACMAKVRAGRVFQIEPGILMDDNIAAGETLTCQAHPSSAKIIIDYDTL